MSALGRLLAILVLALQACAQMPQPAPVREVSADAQSTLTLSEYGSFGKSVVYLSRSQAPEARMKSLPCVVHFHGLRYRELDRDFKEMINSFRFNQSMRAAGKDFLFIAPQGAFGQSKYDLHRRFGKVSQVAALLDWVESSKQIRCDKVILSAHSAGYKVLRPLLSAPANAMMDQETWVKRWREIWLFDALYSDLSSAIENWVEVNDARFAQNVYSRQTRAHSSELPKHAQIRNTRSLISDHWELLTGGYFIEFINKSRALSAP